MMGVGAVKHDIKAMILSGFAGLVAGACSMAIGEFVSVYSQLDIEVAQRKREKERGQRRVRDPEEDSSLSFGLFCWCNGAIACSVIYKGI